MRERHTHTAALLPQPLGRRMQEFRVLFEGALAFPFGVAHIALHFTVSFVEDLVKNRVFMTLVVWFLFANNNDVHFCIGT